MGAKPDELTEIQQRFVKEYVIDFKKKAAAIRAGYDEKSAHYSAFRNLRLPKIMAIVQEEKNRAIEILDIKHEDVLNELKYWALSDITECMGLSIEEIKNLPIEIKRLITSFKTTTKGKGDFKTTTIEINFVSKERALDMINRHIGFYEVDNEQKAPKIDVTQVSDDALQELMNASTSK